jgi:hypothetical protein
MNPLHALPPFLAALPPAHRRLLLCAAIAAASLMSFYVHLLNDSMARAEQRHEVQRHTSSEAPAKPASSPGTAAIVETAGAR